MPKVDNVGVFAQLKFESKPEIVKSLIDFN